jgi:hypothetical protein
MSSHSLSASAARPPRGFVASFFASLLVAALMVDVFIGYVVWTAVAELV